MLQRGRRLLASVLLLALLLAACSAPTPGTSETEIKISATTSILGDLVAQTVGDRAVVEAIIPAGADPHDFAPSAAQADTLTEGDLVVANGLGLEEGLASVLDAARDHDVRLLEVAPALDPIRFGDAESGEHTEDDDPDHDHADHDHGDHGDHGGDHGHQHHLDPHVWLDASRMARAVELIGAELETIDPGSGWGAAADGVAGDLETLHAELKALAGELDSDDRRLVTNHASFGYFADAYGFEIIDSVIPGGSTLAETSARDLELLADQIRELGVPAIFVGVGEGDTTARSLAEATGAEVVELYSDALGEPGSDGDTYQAMMRTNMERIVSALR